MEDKIATLVVKREDGITATTTAETPAGHPDIVVKALSPWKIVIIRTARVFIQSLVGGVTVSSLTNVASMKAAFIFAGSTAAITMLQNIAELLARLDQTVPEIRG